MNNKLAVLLIAGGLAIISVSHLVIENTTYVTEPSTEIELATEQVATQSTIVSETKNSAPVTTMSNPIEVTYKVDTIEKKPKLEFEDRDELVYTTSRVNLREEPDTDSDIYKTIDWSTNLHRVGYSSDGWSKINLDDGEYYICNDYIEVVTQDRLDDIELLARIIWAESGNQSLEGQRAVGSVVYNRWHYDGYGGSDTILGVISFPGQFCGYQSKNWYEDYSDDTYKIACEVYDGHTNAPSGVRNFKTNSCHADWNLEIWKVIGDHTFYYGE